MPMLTFARRPCSVIVARRLGDREQVVAGPTSTSGRCLSIWFGLSPRTFSNCSSAGATKSGCATQVPS